jgi:hypothetical protein
MLRSKPKARDQPATVSLTAIRTLNPPLVLLIVPQRSLNVLVILDMGVDIPLLVHVLKVAPELGPGGISLLEVVVHVQLPVEERVDWRLAVHSG